MSVVSIICSSFVDAVQGHFFKRRTFVFFAFYCGLSSSFGQISPEEHKKHHPEEQQTAPASSSASSQPSPQPGGMMGGDMNAMMERMGVPKPKELYPELINLPHPLSQEERIQIQGLAYDRIESGLALMSEGLSAITISVSKKEFLEMQKSVNDIQEGLTRFDSGLATYRALEGGESPQNAALQWFKQEMHLQSLGVGEMQEKWFGISPFHFFIMLALIAFFFVMISMYFLKMRRAALLLKYLANGKAITPPLINENADNSDHQESLSQQAKSNKKWSGQLQIINIIQETPHVKTFYLVTLGHTLLPFNFLPGQFLSLTVNIEDKKIKRSYTIASSPTQRGHLELTIKREEKGVVSRFFHDTMKKGDKIEVTAPSGNFTFTGEEHDSIVLIAGGVGVTPMMSALRYLTDQYWPGEIFLIFSVKTKKEIIFNEELQDLARKHSNVHIAITLSQPKGDKWSGFTGRITKEMLNQVIPEITSRRFHICGPNIMMKEMKEMLLELEVPQDMIKQESFGAEAKKNTLIKTEILKKSDNERLAKITFSTSGKTTSLAPDQTVLEAAESIGVEIENSCLSGTCGTCKVKLVDGSVHMDCDDALDDQDKSSNIILACQAKSQSDVTIEA
tara:strand:+ start:984 stop:2846 length:1863 start_codon:yes stop_codon:yes gene_type:complete